MRGLSRRLSRAGSVGDVSGSDRVFSLRGAEGASHCASNCASELVKSF